MANREAIYAALFALPSIQDGVFWKTRSRNLQHWQEVEAEKCPALFQAQVRETYEQEAGKPAMIRMQVEWYVYVDRGSNENITASSLLNQALDLVEAALAPGNGNAVGMYPKNTLGGLCVHAWISGTIETDEGTLGNRAVAVVPIEILALSPYPYGAYQAPTNTEGSC